MSSTIGMLWMEGPLSYLEQLCVKSFVDAGHHVILYHYGPVQNIPEGVETQDASQFLPQDGFLLHKRTSSPALHSDVFRYKMLEKSQNVIWADTDAYCLRPFETENGHFYGWESTSHVNGGVLGLPSDCETLRCLLEFTSDEYSIPPYYGKEYEEELIAAKDAGTPVHVSEQPWGVWGPHAITHFLHVTGEIKYALPLEALYPVTFRDRRTMLKPKFDMTGIITENTRSIHFYGRRMRKRLVEREGGVPHHKSLIGGLLKKHNIDPALAPLPVAKPATDAEPVADKPAETVRSAALRPKFTPRVNLTDLADSYGLDKGSAKHRYTELYQLLFLPFKDRKINILELGEHSAPADDPAVSGSEGPELPSIRMWLDFFRKAHIHGLADVETDGFVDDRYSPVICDLDTRSDIAAVAADLPNMQIIIDDASHASHHQQNAFLELWDKLESGGMYIIEDLRWQPKSVEKSGITKTGDLFYGYQVNKTFTHNDPAIMADFSAIEPEISGCFLFQAGYDVKRRNQIAVIHKR